MVKFRDPKCNIAKAPVPEVHCKCVDCKEDIQCGGLWKGDVIGGDAHAFQRVNLVVSHCLGSLDWLANFTQGFKIHDLTITSKCNKPVIGAPDYATVISLPNVGRCDHSYAHWIANKVKNVKIKKNQTTEAID